MSLPLIMEKQGFNGILSVSCEINTWDGSKIVKAGRVVADEKNRLDMFSVTNALATFSRNVWIFSCVIFCSVVDSSLLASLEVPAPSLLLVTLHHLLVFEG